MKFLNSFAVLYLLCLLMVSCIQEEADECVNALDCFNGFVCVDGMCVDPNAHIDEDLVENDTIPFDNDTADVETDDDPLFDLDNNDNDTDQTTSDDEIDEVPDPDTAIECDPGSHFEAEGDDEDGDGERGCVKNVTCISEPCNGGACTELEFTVSCKCTAGYAGRWCTDCDTGYLKSTVDEKCKPDCDHGTYSCTGTKECGVDTVKNEAGCVCKEFFSGTDCTLCDTAHFCSSHGTCSASTGSAVCTCDAAWSGNANCSTCGQGYIVDGANCIEGCTDYCGATVGTMFNIGGTMSMVNATSYGDCQIKSGEATCVCDAGWETTSTIVFPPIIKPACSDCDTDNPPVGGCPE